MTSVSAGHIILTPTQPVGSGWPQRESNPGPPHQESHALPTELPRPHLPCDWLPPPSHHHNLVMVLKKACASSTSSWVKQTCITHLSDSSHTLLHKNKSKGKRLIQISSKQHKNKKINTIWLWMKKYKLLDNHVRLGLSTKSDQTT